jgi:hypothetical protein|tara:strand:+ start:140 stop:583 length:444 start_codon:yes stop_codon:yes gene_type:complete
MAHIRKAIREHVVTTVTSLSTTGSNVYETRYFPLQTGNLPALIVYTLDETVEDYTIGQNTRTQFRALNLIIEAHCRGTANIDDTLDTIAEEVEEAMVTDISRGGNAKDTKLVSTEVDFDTASQKTGLMRLTYLISYNTIENAVQTGV